MNDDRVSDEDNGNEADDEEDRQSSPSRTANRSQTGKPHVTVYNLFEIKQLRWPLLAAFGCQVAQQFSGVNAAIFYSTSIFQQSYDAQTALVLTMIISLVNIVMTCVSLVLIEKIGRKTLLISSQLVMAVCALGLAIAFNADFPPAVIAFLLMAFVGGFAIGLGPIPWCVNFCWRIGPFS